MEKDYNGMNAFDIQPSKKQQQQHNSIWYMSFESQLLNAIQMLCVTNTYTSPKAHSYRGECHNWSAGISNILENINFTKKQKPIQMHKIALKAIYYSTNHLHVISKAIVCAFAHALYNALTREEMKKKTYDRNGKKPHGKQREKHAWKSILFNLWAEKRALKRWKNAFTI